MSYLRADFPTLWLGLCRFIIPLLGESSNNPILSRLSNDGKERWASEFNLFPSFLWGPLEETVTADDSISSFTLRMYKLHITFNSTITACWTLNSHTLNCQHDSDQFVKAFICLVNWSVILIFTYHYLYHFLALVKIAQQKALNGIA